MTKSAVSKFWMVFGLAALTLFTWTSSAFATSQVCESTVFVNDREAVVRIDGVKMGHGTLQIPCSSQERSLEVISSDGQIFSRMLAASESSLDLNVVFHPIVSRYENGAAYLAYMNRETKKVLVNPVVPAKSSVLASNAKIRMTAISQVQTEMHTELPRTPAAKPVKDESADMMMEGHRISGYFVQIHTMTGPLDKVRMNRELRQKGLPNEPVQLCVWRTPDTREVRTRALAGPFASFEIANRMSEQIGQKAFVLRKDPFCDQQ